MKESMNLNVFKDMLAELVDDTDEITEDYLLRGDQVNVDQKTIALSSLQIVEVIVNIESRYNITITDDEVLLLRTVSDVIRIVNEEVLIEEARNREKEDIKKQLFGEI